MYLYVLIVCGSVSLGWAEILFHTDHMEHMHRYYACYFNKYFKLSADENKYEADRDMFVKAKIDAHQKYEERAPTPSCVKWMCDPKMIWDWRKEDKLETWTYFAQPGARGGVSPPQVGMSAFTIAMGRLINIVGLWPYGQHGKHC